MIPKFWFFRNELNDAEKRFLNFATKNDKKFLFTPEFSKLVSDSGFAIEHQENAISLSFSRKDIAELSSFNKLADAEKHKNIAILEVCNIPEELNIDLSFVLLRKEKHQLDAKSLFA